jgi:hypothetical protein
MGDEPQTSKTGLRYSLVAPEFAQGIQHGISPKRHPAIGIGTSAKIAISADVRIVLRHIFEEEWTA